MITSMHLACTTSGCATVSPKQEWQETSRQSDTKARTIAVHDCFNFGKPHACGAVCSATNTRDTFVDRGAHIDSCVWFAYFTNSTHILSWLPNKTGKRRWRVFFFDEERPLASENC